MKRNLYYLLLFALLLQSCAGKLYSHYPKVKKQQSVKQTTQKGEVEKQILRVEQIKIEGIIQQIISLPESQKAGITLLPKPLQNQQVKSFAKQKVDEKDSTTLPTTDVVNKNAKIAFWSAIGILSSGAAALAFGEFFALLIPFFTLLAFIFSIIALRQIKRTGEYGQPKADFALILSVPILLITLSVLIFLVAQGGLTFTIGITF